MSPATSTAAGRSWLAWLFGFLIVMALLFAGYTWLVLTWSYSQGERAGYVQKFSHKGWICKTWEGELAIQLAGRAGGAAGAGRAVPGGVW